MFLRTATNKAGSSIHLKVTLVSSRSHIWKGFIICLTCWIVVSIVKSNFLTAGNNWTILLPAILTSIEGQLTFMERDSTRCRCGNKVGLVDYLRSNVEPVMLVTERFLSFGSWPRYSLSKMGGKRSPVQPWRVRETRFDITGGTKGF